MMPRPEITMGNVPDPADRWCQGAMGGHRVPEGALFKKQPVRFFRLTGKAKGTYCEPCLVVANGMARYEIGAR